MIIMMLIGMMHGVGQRDVMQHHPQPICSIVMISTAKNDNDCVCALALGEVDGGNDSIDLGETCKGASWIMMIILVYAFVTVYVRERSVYSKAMCALYRQHKNYETWSALFEFVSKNIGMGVIDGVNRRQSPVEFCIKRLWW